MSIGVSYLDHIRVIACYNSFLDVVVDPFTAVGIGVFISLACRSIKQTADLNQCDLVLPVVKRGAGVHLY